MQAGQNKYVLWSECIVIFIVLPLLLWLKVITTPLLMLPLFLICLPAAVWLGKKYGFSRAVFWSGEQQAEREQLVKIINRFVLNSVLLFVLLLLRSPQHLFDLPRNMPRLWLLLMVLYPLLSVYPQELLYRAFFFKRYGALFQKPLYLVLWNAVLFGWLHIVFDHVVSIVLSLIGGLLFADTYRRTHSLRLTWLEHTLYGNLIFTLGYAQAFLYEPWLRSFNVS